MKEKLFKIMQHNGFGPDGKDNVEYLMLKESELTEAHKDLFLGNLLKEWDKSPKDTQIRFIQMLLDATKEKDNERFTNIINQIS